MIFHIKLKRIAVTDSKQRSGPIKLHGIGHMKDRNQSSSEHSVGYHTSRNPEVNSDTFTKVSIINFNLKIGKKRYN